MDYRLVLLVLFLLVFFLTQNEKVQHILDGGV